MKKLEDNNPGYKWTKLGWIPEEWQYTQLGDVYKIIVSPVDKKTKPDELPVKLCNYTDVYYKNWINQQTDFMDATASKDEISKYKLYAGDVIITKDSETPDDIAVPAMVTEDVPRLVCGYHLAILRSNGQVNGMFLFYMLNHPLIHHWFGRRANGATRFGLNLDSIQAMPFCIPSAIEREQITQILSTWDKAIDTLDDLIEKKQELKKGLMQQLLTGKTRFPEFEPEGGTKYKETKLGWVPEDWEIKKIAETAFNKKGSIKIGPFGSQLKKNEFQTDGIKVFDQETVFTNDFNIGKNYISSKKYESLKSCTVYPGDLLISMMGTTGKTVVVPSHAPLGILNSHLLRIQPDKTIVDTSYLKRFLGESYYSRKQIQRLGHGGIMHGLSASIVKSILIILPNIKEQKRIEKAIQKYDDETKDLTIIRELTTKMKKGLMQNLLTGKIRVQTEAEE